MDAISSEVRALSEAYDVVVTSGGLGPTPDDVTMAGVAEAFGHLLIRQDSLSCFHAIVTPGLCVTCLSQSKGCILKHTVQSGELAVGPLCGKDAHLLIVHCSKVHRWHVHFQHVSVCKCMQGAGS